LPDTLPIKLLAMDVDGVMTDGGIIVHDDGSESKRFNVRDGAWIRIWKRQNLKTAIITGRQSGAVQHRAAELEIDFIYEMAHNKLEVLDELIRDSGLGPEHIAYIGDDVMDLPVINRVGFSATVPEAPGEVRQAVDYVTSTAGGAGAVAEMIRWLLRKMGLWEAAMSRYRQAAGRAGRADARPSDRHR